MALPVNILDGYGGGYQARVTSNNALKVSNTPAVISDLTLEQLTAKKTLVEAFTDHDLSTAMAVSASLGSPQRFSISSTEFTLPGGTKIYKCQFIKTIKLVFIGTDLDPTVGGNLRRFGPVAGGITNGLKLQVLQQGVIMDVFLQPVKVMSDIFEYTTSYMSFTDVAGGGVDELILTIELAEPIAIPASSLDRIDLVIQDNLSGFVDIHAQILGWFEWSDNADPTGVRHTV